MRGAHSANAEKAHAEKRGADVDNISKAIAEALPLAMHSGGMCRNDHAMVHDTATFKPKKPSQDTNAFMP